MVAIAFFHCIFSEHFRSGTSPGAFWFVFPLFFFLLFYSTARAYPPLEKKKAFAASEDLARDRRFLEQIDAAAAYDDDLMIARLLSENEGSFRFGHCVNSFSLLSPVLSR